MSCVMETNLLDESLRHPFLFGLTYPLETDEKANICILRTLMRHRCTWLFVEICPLWVDAGFFALFACGCQGWWCLAGFWFLQELFLSSRSYNVILSPLSGSGVSLMTQELVRYSGKFEKLGK